MLNIGRRFWPTGYAESVRKKLVVAGKPDKDAHDRFLAIRVLTIAAIRAQPVSFTLYMAGLLYLALAAPNLVLPDPLSSVGRVLLVSIPAFLLVGRWMRRWPALDLLIVAGGFMLQAALTTYYLSGGWVE